MSSQSNCTSVVGSLTCLTRGDTAGVTAQIAAALLSSSSILYAILFIVIANRRASARSSYHPMDIFILSLLLADGVQSIGGLLSIKWVKNGIVTVGSYCDAQGIVEIFGETGVALFTLLITIHTFTAVLTGRDFRSLKIAFAIVVGIWIFIAILVAVGYGINRSPSKSSFFSPQPYWCWVSQDYGAWRIVAEYLWLWIALFVSIILYFPLCLWLRGNLVFNEAQRIVSRSDRWKALVMLVYPIAYCICILPLSVVRWITFTQQTKSGVITMSSTATFAVITIFYLSGFFNVVLLFKTKPNLGLLGQQESSTGRPPSPSLINRVRPEPDQEVVGLPMERLHTTNRSLPR